ncbi:hypothetical protein GCM10008986_10340 [Salinibacillus aidingensis]|uniref:SLH domain-containing protein n=1 Tax=Salinibacillus aidingensis TaxID=237684 RepID=A0ABN1AZ12_9BACI
MKRANRLRLLICCLLILGFTFHAIHIQASTVKDEYQVSSGTYYQELQVGQQDSPNSMRVMEIDLSDTYTNVEVGYPSSLTTLQETTSQAMKYHQDGHQVAGAINGGFYYTRNGEPMNLISKDNRLISAGKVGESNEAYVNESIAFGIDKNGQAKIAEYDLDLMFEHQGHTYEITSHNKERKKDNLILYTSSYHNGYADTNPYGREVVIKTTAAPDLQFGETYNGEVVAIYKKGDQTDVAIPENGFVLSGNGDGRTILSNLEAGDSINLSIDINSEWMHSEFMLASGPRLVKDGEVSLSMNPDSYRASLVAPRTAVAIDATGEKVFFVTVDGRQPGYSRGMNLSEFARYLVDLGAEYALNLDGGGSTTMAVRQLGDEKISVVNSPSGGSERGVSTILMGISTEPAAQSLYYRDISPGDTHYEGVHWISDKGIKGYEDGSFGPGKSLTRAHAAIMFTRALDLKTEELTKETSMFKDISTDHPYAEFIHAVDKNGIFKGRDGEFLPGQSLTRQQMASTLVNAFDLEKYQASHVDINLGNVGKSHKENVQILADLGITNQLNNYRPREAVTRGQFATFLYLSYQAVKE